MYECVCVCVCVCVCAYIPYAALKIRITRNIWRDSHHFHSHEQLQVMICGHADKIRMQVRHIADDGKVYIDSVRQGFLSLSGISKLLTS